VERKENSDQYTELRNISAGNRSPPLRGWGMEKKTYRWIRDQYQAL